MSLAGNWGRHTWVRYSSRSSSATRFTISACGIFMPPNIGSFQRLGFLTCAQMLMHAIARGGCADTVRESALEADSTGRQILCRTGDSNPRLAFQSDALPLVQCCFTPTESIRLIRDGEPRTATSTLTQLKIPYYFIISSHKAPELCSTS